ncbi:hypothetical protein ACT5AX_002480 [Cronobacter sakazakii]|uniref:hypothetical protein n=1 Tax=Cronobacter sakazakii TaxID=28141 RepID=UPI0007ABB4B7|nr:hypothetical protein [Cronobacter sakazakii]ELY4345902.1 hypothetical protein [Cronobacter sakazakii]KZE21159.1 hypothetical protein AVZ29_08305 [Cronobacter sakazakii]
MMIQDEHDSSPLDTEYAEFWDTFNKRYEDPLVIDVKKAYRWFIEIIGENEWFERRAKVINYFRNMSERLYSTNTSVSFQDKDSRLAFYDDWVAWYLYLAESLADRPTVDEPAQSSRIWNFLAMIGEHAEALKTTKGINEKLHDLLIKPGNQPDSTLFELVVAICYLRNGWAVEFIPETGARKTPDLFIVKGSEQFYVECKRLAKVTQYSEEERGEWVERWQVALPLTIRYPAPVFFNVLFKVEINKTSKSIFRGAVETIYKSGVLTKGQYAVCENDEVLVQAHLIDMQRVDEHLDKWNVKYPSPQLNSLLDDDYDSQGSYTMACQAQLCTFSNDEFCTNNIFVDKLKMPFCAKWECVAEESLNKKAKDVKGLLVKAVKQAPLDGSTIVHIGYETLHGPEVEFIRERKICELLASFDYGEKDIAAIYCHSFQPRLFADGNWDYAETVRYFSKSRNAENLLQNKLLLSRAGTVESNDTHWAQDFRERMNK